MGKESPPGLEFEHLVAALLRGVGFTLEYPHGDVLYGGYDFLATIHQETYAVEVKYYRTERAQEKLLEAAASRLISALKKGAVQRAMLAVSCMISTPLRMRFLEEYGVRFLDRNDILLSAAKISGLLDQFVAVLEETRATPESSPDARSWLPELAAVDPIPPTAIEEPIPDFEGTRLWDELRVLRKGKKAWPAYERLCKEILQYLFSADLHGWHAQKRTDDGLNRFDYICRIRPTTDFWRFLLEHLHSRYALFEFKNYQGKIQQGQMLTTEKYLLDRALRRAAIIFTREGGDDGAVGTAQGAMREHGKLMLILQDTDVCRMLEMKQHGEDPSDFLFEKADEFLMSLPR